MAVVSGPSLNTDGVVFSLDASSPNCWNVGVSTAFVDSVNSHQGFPINDLYHSDGPFVDAGYVEFDGTGDYLTIATHASDFNFGTGDFTIEFWINSTQTSRADPFAWNFGYTFAGWGSFILNVSSGRIDWYEGLGIATYATSTGWNDGLWHHLAVSRSGTSLKVFLDGVQIGTTASSSYSYGASDVGVSVGFSTSTGYYLNGQMSNVRIVKGTALYTSNFTPPTKPLTDISGTKLLTCQGNTIADASFSAHTITANGDAAAKLGSPSYFEFDGTSDFIDFPASSDFALGTGNFTIELWMNSGVNSNDTFYRRMYMTDGPTGNASGNLQIAIEPSTGKVNLWENSGDLNLLGTSNITNSTWNHIVAVRLGSTLKIYVNGVEESSTTYSTSVTANSGSPRPRIGNYSGGGGTGDYNGKISNFKIYKGTGLSPKQIRQNYNALKGRYA